MMRFVLLMAALSSASVLAQEEKKPQPKEQKPESSQVEKGAPSLAELARRTREERERNAAAVPVYTNSALRTLDAGKVGQSQAPVVAAPGEAGGAPADEGGEGAADPNAPVDQTSADLEQIRQEILAKKLEYVTAVNQSQVAQLSLNSMRDRFLQESDAAAQEKFEQDLTLKLEELRDNLNRIRDLRGELDELSRKARNAGMEAGILRNLIGTLPEPAQIEAISSDSE